MTHGAEDARYLFHIIGIDARISIALAVEIRAEDDPLALEVGIQVVGCDTVG